MSDAPAKLVDIVLPTGEAATVPEKDLGQAMAAGAKIPDAPAATDTSALEQAGAALTGAASSISLGGYERGLKTYSYIRGGKEKEREVMGDLARLREQNPYSTMVGEGAGLFLSPVSALGSATEGAAAARFGEGLLARTGAMAARGAAEAGAMGAQQQITEDILGDHETTGQKLFAAASKNALLGGALGAGLGLGSAALGEAAGLLRRSPGPAPDALLDEVAGVPGAGRGVRDSAKSAEGFVEDLRKTGLMSDQAGQIADDVAAAARDHVAAGPASGMVDAGVDAYAQKLGGASERADLIRRQYAESAGQLLKHDEALDIQAQKMARTGTRAMRDLEDTMNEVNFQHKPDQMAKLVDAGRLDMQRDAVAGMLQQGDDTLKFWEGTAAKGGAEGAVKSLRKTWTDVLDKLAKVDEVGGQTASRDLFIGMDKFKREVDSFARWGTNYGLPEAVMHETAGIRRLSDKLRAGLEDESIWGKAGAAQRDWNETFSNAKARRDHFGRDLGVVIDQQRGVSLPEVDIEKARGLLSRLKGTEFDADVQGVKSTEAFIDGLRGRLAAIEKHGDLSAAQRAKLASGSKALDEFEATFAESRKEAAMLNRLKAARAEEQGKGIGGLWGLVADVYSKPLTTMDRIGAIRSTVQRVEEGTTKALDKFFYRKGAGSAAEGAATLRPKADVVKEMGEIKELAGNPIALGERVERMVGDLGKYAPNVANEVKATAMRAMLYLANEAPKPVVPLTLLGVHNAKPRYSDTQTAAWEAKRNAVLGTQTQTPQQVLIEDMHQGKLNRDAIKAIEFVSPKLFAELQDTARQELARMEQRGLLDKMPYQQQAALATLLHVPADGTWKPDFIGLMQAAKVMPPPEPKPAPGAAPVMTSKRAIKLNTNIYGTESMSIEQGSAAA